MSDVDDELLALAGGGDSSEDDVPQKRTRHSAAASDDDESEARNGARTSARWSRSASETRPTSRGGSFTRGNGSPGLSGRAAKKTAAKKSRRRAHSDAGSEEDGKV